MDLITNLSVVSGKNGLFVYIDKFSNFYWIISISWGRESLVLGRYHISFLNMLLDYLGYPPAYSMTKIFISLLYFGRVYSRYLAHKVFFSLLSIDWWLEWKVKQYYRVDCILYRIWGYYRLVACYSYDIISYQT